MSAQIFRRWTPLLLAFALLLSGCGSLNHVSAPAPEIVAADGSTLGDRTPWCTANPALAETLRGAIEVGEDVRVQGWSSEAIAACLDELMTLPELFWFRGYHLTATTGLRTSADVTFTWLYDDGPARYTALCDRADEILADAPWWEGDFALARYLYDWLEEHVTYEAREGYDQTAYAAICEGSAVCSGIADAFAFLLRRAGHDACTITGEAVQDGERSTHAWNYAVLDGAVYAFDLTWDNTDRFDWSGREYLSHEWFAVTSAQMNIAHTPADARDQITATANADNFYLHEGYLLTEDSINAVCDILSPQLAAGSNVLTFRCADRAVYDAICFRLFDLGEVSSALRRIGAIGSGGYTLSYTRLDDLFSVNLFL